MAHQFCDHLDEYGAQYTLTEASYKQCVHLLDQIMSQGPSAELAGLVTKALQEWVVEDKKLRDLLVSEVKAGRVRIPTGLLRKRAGFTTGKRRAARKSGHPVCAECRFVVPRLVYPEWKIAHSGAATFRGQDVVLAEPVAV